MEEGQGKNGKCSFFIVSLVKSTKRGHVSRSMMACRVEVLKKKIQVNRRFPNFLSFSVSLSRYLAAWELG